MFVMSKRENNTKQETGPFIAFTNPNSLYKKISIDKAGPTIGQSNRKKYFATLIDRFSRFVWTEATKKIFAAKK
jgi:hypothetical protein